MAAALHLEEEFSAYPILYCYFYYRQNLNCYNEHYEELLSGVVGDLMVLVLETKNGLYMKHDRCGYMLGCEFQCLAARYKFQLIMLYLTATDPPLHIYLYSLLYWPCLIS
jgi:hypothetical protein